MGSPPARRSTAAAGAPAVAGAAATIAAADEPPMSPATVRRAARGAALRPDRRPARRATPCRAWRGVIGALALAGAATPGPHAAGATPPAGAGPRVDVADEAVQPPTARLLFLGDVTFGRAIATAVARHGADAPLAPARAALRAPDLTIANLEGPLAPPGPDGGAAPGRIDLAGPTAAAGALARAGVDVVSLANNHSLDAGVDGLRRTAAALAAAGVTAIGGRGGAAPPADRPGPGAAAIRRVGALRVALLAYTTVLGPGTDRDQAADAIAVLDAAAPGAAERDVAAARSAADVVVVVMHWGVEGEAAPRPIERRLARALVVAGADLVVGAHPHVVQPVEWVATGRAATRRPALVAYALGNALFDQWTTAATRDGLALEVVVDRSGVVAAQRGTASTRPGRRGPQLALQPGGALDLRPAP